MSDQIVATLPVFLPGGDRDWLQVEGQMIINEAGVMTIHLSKENSDRLVDLAKEGILFQVSFDYRMSIERVAAIKERMQKVAVQEVLGNHTPQEGPPWLLN